jgi:hypothetical protein
MVAGLQVAATVHVKSMAETFGCPHCGADVPVGALACPVCGSDENTGWSEQAELEPIFYDYDDEFEGDYDGPDERGSSSNPWFRLAVVVIAVITVSAVVAASFPAGIYLVPLLFLAVGALYYYSQIYPNTEHARKRELYQDLLWKAQGDEAMIERWIEYERKRSPDLKEIELMEDAIYRWERDNR